jgi:D-amino-acid dehydrogenase
VAQPISSDVVVVGGGLVGASAAYELAVAGLDVALVDAPLAGRASDAGAGIASPATFVEPDDEWYRFAAAAAEHLRALVDRLRDDGVDDAPDVVAECGSLVLALAEHEDPWFEQVLELSARRDRGVVEVSPTEAQAMFPPLCRPWRALYSPRSARVDGRRLTAALRAAAARRGVTVVEEEVTGVECEAGRVVAVAGVKRTVHCGSLVLAAGAWSMRLAEQLGAVLPVSPTKGEIVHLGLPAGDGGAPYSGRWPIVQPVLNFYLVPWPGGRVACGGTFEAKAGFDVRPTAGGIGDLLRECVSIAPGLADAALLETRVGLRPTSPDDRPMLGPLPPLADVHACTGHGANGLLLGPYSAALVAAGIVDGAAPAELLPFAAARFATG